MFCCVAILASRSFSLLADERIAAQDSCVASRPVHMLRLHLNKRTNGDVKRRVVGEFHGDVPPIGLVRHSDLGDGLTNHFRVLVDGVGHQRFPFLRRFGSGLREKPFIWGNFLARKSRSSVRMQLRRMSSTNLMRFTLASIGPRTSISSVVQTTGLPLFMGEEYMQRQQGIGRPQTQSQASPPIGTRWARRRVAVGVLLDKLLPSRESVASAHDILRLSIPHYFSGYERLHILLSLLQEWQARI